MGVSAFISPGGSLDRALERVKLADGLGYEAVYTTHIAGRDSLTLLMAYAAVSERARLGTGVLPIFSRTPAATAQSAVTIDEYSGGRMVLGIGVSHKITVENWYGAEIDKPVAQMREYASIVKAILSGEDPPEGEHFRTNFHFAGIDPRPQLPVYIAALSPNMLRLAGEIADGVMLWLCSPDYISSVVIPNVREGRAAAGRSMEDFDVVAAVPVGLAEDAEEARASMRNDLVPYASLPFYRAMLERSGFEADLAAFDQGMAEGDVGKAKGGLSDELLASLAGIGGPGELRSTVQRYLDAGATSPGIGGIPRTDFEGALEAVAELI